MNKITAFVVAATLAASATLAHAGGPVIIADEPDPVVVVPAGFSGGLGTGGAIVAGLVGLALIAALASSDDSSSSTTTGSDS